LGAGTIDLLGEEEMSCMETEEGKKKGTGRDESTTRDEESAAGRRRRRERLPGLL